jgi:hypothetical protein
MYETWPYISVVSREEESVENLDKRLVLGGHYSSHRNQRLYFLRTQSEPSAKDRSDSSSDLNRRSLSAKWNPARKRGSRAEKLAQDCSQGDESIASEKAALV